MNRDFQINALRTKTKFKIASVRLQMKQHIFEKLKEMFDEDTLKAPLLSIKEALDDSLEHIRKERNERCSQSIKENLDKLDSVNKSLKKDVSIEFSENPTSKESADACGLDSRKEIDKAAGELLDQSKIQRPERMKEKEIAKKKNSKKNNKEEGIVKKDQLSDVEIPTKASSSEKRKKPKQTKHVSVSASQKAKNPEDYGSEDNKKVMRNAAKNARLSIKKTNQRLNSKIEDSKDDQRSKMKRVSVKRENQESKKRQAKKIKLPLSNVTDNPLSDATQNSIVSVPTIEQESVKANGRLLGNTKIKKPIKSKIATQSTAVKTEPIVENDTVQSRQITDIPLLLSDSTFDNSRVEPDLTETMSDIELPQKRFPGLKKYFYDSESSMMSYVTPKRKTNRKRR